MTNMVKEKRASVRLSQITKEALDSIKHPEQSYGGIILELIRFWKEQGGARLK